MATATGLADRAEQSWTKFRAAVDRAARLDVATPSGWTLRAMLAHVAAWHDATAYRLHRFTATGVPQDKVEPDDDAFNARVARESAKVSDDRIVAALDASYARLQAAIGELPVGYADDDEGWVEAVVAGNTYDHYPEHQAELTAAEGAQATNT